MAVNVKLLVKTALILIFFAAGLWLAGLFWFAEQINHEVAEPDTVTDGIVVLTGGSNRLRTAIRLLSENKAKKLLISGVWNNTTLADLKKLDDIPEEEITKVQDRIVLGYLAKNTKGNAKETAIWMALEKYQSIRLVTANYHVPRSLLEFTRALPGKKIIIHPVIPDNVRTKEWWHFPGTAFLIVSEYDKYLGVLADQRFLQR